MKKTSIGIIMLFFAYVLVACAASPRTDSFRLLTPTNIKIEKNILTFNPVEHANSYILSINGTNIEIFEPTFTFTEDGDYRIRIQTKSGSEDYLDSLFTEAYDIRIRFLQYPDDIAVINNQVSFTVDEDAESYDVEIDGIIYNTLEDLPPYLTPGTYQIRVKARSDVYNESEFSPIQTITVDATDRIETHHAYLYSIHSTFELPLFTYKKEGLNYIEVQETVYENKEMVEVEALVERRDYYASNNTIYFSTSYMNHLVELMSDLEGDQIKVVHFVIHTNLGDHMISLELNKLETPYSYSGATQHTNFNDPVTFGFDIFDYNFVKVEGENITKDNYTFDDGVLNIYVDFLTAAYNQKRSQESIEFVVIFQKDEEIYEYSIYITK